MTCTLHVLRCECFVPSYSWQHSLSSDGHKHDLTHVLNADQHSLRSFSPVHLIRHKTNAGVLRRVLLLCVLSCLLSRASRSMGRVQDTMVAKLVRGKHMPIILLVTQASKSAECARSAIHCSCCLCCSGSVRQHQTSREFFSLDQFAYCIAASSHFLSRS